MKMKPHKINEAGVFISGWYMETMSLADEIIDYYESSDKKFIGVTSKGVEKHEKDSVDCPMDNYVLVNSYATHLQKCANMYAEQYNFCNMYDAWGIEDLPNIQRYNPGGGYHGWHCERSSKKSPVGQRHLAYLTYLNDVTDCGETEFYYQKTKIVPEKGLTVIFPVDWTFTHRGVTSPSQIKYVITGWFNFK